MNIVIGSWKNTMWLKFSFLMREFSDEFKEFRKTMMVKVDNDHHKRATEYSVQAHMLCHQSSLLA